MVSSFYWLRAFQKPVGMRARQVQSTHRVATSDGMAMAYPGDWIVQTTKQDQRVMPNALFHQLMELENPADG